jgi:uncharacterized protein (DUF885 family)
MTEILPTSRMDDVATRFWEAYLELSPAMATVYGDDRYDDRLDDPGPAGRAELRSLSVRARDEALAVPADTLSVEDRITRDMLGIVADLHVQADDLAIHELQTLSHIDGVQTLLAQLAVFQPADTPERLDRWLRRLRGYDALMDASITILREGMASGRTSARIVAERTIAQLEGLLGLPVDASPVVRMSRVADGAAREQVAGVVRDVVLPADRRLLDFLRDEYLATTREHPGLASVPGGDELYRYAIRAWTTLDMEPREVHEVGLEELAAIDRERRIIARDQGFGDDVDGYRRALAADPANQATTPEALLDRARENIARAAAVAPQVFGRLPVADCEVRPVEAFKEQDAPFAYYFPPSVDQSRPGIYYVNTYDLPSRTFGKLASITYHEAIPGHHFQVALEMEQTSLNVFRRLGSRMVGAAYVEGWGLYSERLADELGLYRHPGERLGMLDAQAWRASRLIVDSGLHGLGWTRRQSIDWMLATGLSETDAVIETDRYIVWPGQALSYMTGLREIRRLRRELETTLGDGFELRRFHDELLGHGSLPLATLARELPSWLAAAP